MYRPNLIGSSLHARPSTNSLRPLSICLLSTTRPASSWRSTKSMSIASASEDRPAREVKVEDDLYIRDYDKCIMCFRCVAACGPDAQNTFAIDVAGRGLNSTIATEFDIVLPESACVYCGNCVGVCPTGALMFKTEYDMRERRDMGRAISDGCVDGLFLLRSRAASLNCMSRTTRSSR